MGRIISYCNISTDADNLVGLYHSLGMGYPKFFKMDSLSRAGLVAAEIVLQKAGLRNDDPKPDMSVVLVNRSSSTCNDVEFQKSLAPDNYFPSPSLFVYTLSNIVCGEIAIRNRILGETSFFVQEDFSPEFMAEAIGWAFADKAIKYVLCGWVECQKGRQSCMMALVENDGRAIEPETLESLYK